MLSFNKRLSKVLIWIIAISLLNYGCIAFHPKSAAKDELGYFVKHYKSCGVLALRMARANFNDHAKLKEISREIQNTGNLSRALLSLAHHDSFDITWPHEIKNHLNKHGYKVREINDFESLKEGDTAIVLIKGRFLSQEWHWMCYPNGHNIETYFGEGTKIIKIYLIEKR